jgi:hypothetical protein
MKFMEWVTRFKISRAVGREIFKSGNEFHIFNMSYAQCNFFCRTTAIKSISLINGLFHTPNDMNNFRSFISRTCDSYLCFEIDHSLILNKLKAASHLSENRGTKGYEWGKWTECARIQRIKTNLTSSYPIINYCQI